MFNSFGNIFKIADLKKKILFTIAIPIQRLSTQIGMSIAGKNNMKVTGP